MPMAMGIMEKIYNGFGLKEPMYFFLFFASQIIIGATH